MEWKKGNCIQINMAIIDIKPKDWDKKRIMYIKKAHNTCYYCGGSHKKYLYCIKQFPNYDNIIVVCKLCYMITNIDHFLHTGELILMYSKCTQLDIIRQTINNLQKECQVPLFTDIDKNIKKSPISILEYLAVKDKINDDNYKIFFTDKLDKNFVLSLLDPDCYGFTDEENQFNDTDSDSKLINCNDQLAKLQEHLLLPNHKKILDDTFNISKKKIIKKEINYEDNMKHISNIYKRDNIMNHYINSIYNDAIEKKKCI